MGEKLYEALFWDYEEYYPVEGDAIYALRLKQNQVQWIEGNVIENVTELVSVAKQDEKRARSMLEELITALSKIDQAAPKVKVQPVAISAD